MEMEQFSAFFSNPDLYVLVIKQFKPYKSSGKTF